MGSGAKKQKFTGIAIILVCGLAVFGLVAYFMLENSGTVAAAGKTSASPDTMPVVKANLNKVNTGPSGLPIPRFVSLKRDKVNVRLGPSSQHKIAWIFKLKGLPVEIIAEFELWRRIRDSQGQEGWVYHSLLSGRRTVLVAPWRKGDNLLLYADPEETSDVIAKVASGAIGKVKACTGKWCEVRFAGYQGWIPQNSLWGVYQGEKLKN